jgi:hypothetical protein
MPRILCIRLLIERLTSKNRTGGSGWQYRWEILPPMHSTAVREFFREKSLQNLMRAAARFPEGRRGDADFGTFQFRTLEELFVGARFDFGAISAIRLNEEQLPAGFDCVFLDLDESILRNYDKVAAYDLLSPVVHTNPGRVVSHDMVFDAQAWLSSPLFLNHCKVYDFHKVMRIAFRYPSMDRKVISFDFMGSIENNTWESLDTRLLELACFPFALTWFLRKGVLDDARYVKYMSRLSDLTPTQLLYLRKFVNSPWQDLALQAKELGYSHGGYKQTLYSIRDAIIDRLSLPERAYLAIKSPSLRVIDHDYAFLSMMGDPSVKLVRK